jgi:hypothetical protein
VRRCETAFTGKVRVAVKVHEQLASYGNVTDDAIDDVTGVGASLSQQVDVTAALGLTEEAHPVAVAHLPVSHHEHLVVTSVLISHLLYNAITFI